MTLVKKLDPIEPKEEILLTSEQALTVFNMLVDGKGINKIKHTLFIPAKKLITLKSRLLEIQDMMQRIVKGQAILVREESHIETNEETGIQTKVIDVAQVLCPVPQTLEKLQERSIELISNDYNISEPLFKAESVAELVEGINIVVAAFISHSNNDNTATYDWWKAQTIGG